MSTFIADTKADLAKLTYKTKDVSYSYKPSSKETMIALTLGPTDYHLTR